jgi:DNA-binding FadR family transcriptional regulator
MRPGDGTYVCPLDFYTAIRPLVLYTIACDRGNFDRFYRLRATLEVAFWDDAVRRLGEEQIAQLHDILAAADHKLGGTPIEIPHRDHRDFHVTIYGQLDNPFAQGLLKAYWDAYEAVGLHRYFELSYYKRVWANHREMVDHIARGQYDDGKRVLLRHFTLLEDRLQANGQQSASQAEARH